MEVDEVSARPGGLLTKHDTVKATPAIEAARRKAVRGHTVSGQLEGGSTNEKNAQSRAAASHESVHSRVNCRTWSFDVSVLLPLASAVFS